MSVEALVANVLADKKIDAAEVVEIRTAFMADGVIDNEELKALFTMNEAAEEKDPTWTPAFIEMAEGNLLADGIIDADEEAALITMLGDDIDDVEMALLKSMEGKCALPESLKALIK